MLTPETPFPYVGSYALHIDMDQPAPQAAELVRIHWRRTERSVDRAGRSTARAVGQDGRANETEYVMVSFPLRDGAGGNKVVAAAALIDATPLDGAETREFHDLDRLLRGRSPRKGSGLARKAARRDALKARMLWAPFLARRLGEHRARQASQRRAA
jgi:hypothetical protein